MMVVISNVDMRLNTSQFLSRKSWAFVQNVLGFDMVRPVIEDEKFEVVFTDAGEGSGGIAPFLKQLRNSRKSSSAVCVLVTKDVDHPLSADVESDRLFKRCQYPLNEEDMSELRELIEIARTGVPKTVAQARPFDARLINAVLSGVRDVLGDFFGKDSVQLGKPGVRKQALPVRSGITGLISIEGDQFRGSMAIASSLEFLQQLNARIFPDQAVPLTRDTSKDLIAELSNQMVGRIKARFGQLGLQSKIGLPQVFLGKNHDVPHTVTDSTALVLPIRVLEGVAEIELALYQDEAFVIDTTQATQSAQGMLLFDD